MIKKLFSKIIYFINTRLVFKFINQKKFVPLLRIADANNYQNNNKNFNSVIFWTTHKCASTFIAKFLESIAKASNLEHLDYAGNIWSVGNAIKLDNPYSIESECSFLYRKYGEIYGPMRTPFEFINRSKLNNIFFLRDPRDIIISNYYSTAYSHSIPSHNYTKKLLLQKRTKTKKMDINDYFLEQIESWVIGQYEMYKFFKENSELTSVHKYEDLKENPNQTFLRITKSMNIDISEELMNNLISSFEEPFKKKLNKKLHIRNGKSRQFEHELNRDTIIKGNEKLRGLLDYWEFKI